MPFLPVKCPNCGGNIELDDQREKGFCMYCGSQIVYKEAVQKMELSGVVSVKGVADVEKLLQNAETFVKLNVYKKASAILLRVTDDYPEDYRGWWQLAKFAISCPFKAGIPARMRELVNQGDLSWYGSFIFCSEFQSKYEFYWYISASEGLVPRISLYNPLTLMRNAVNLAPTETATEMKRQVKEWLQTYMAFYSLALKYLQEDVKKAPEDPRYHLWKINQECEKRAQELYDCNEKRGFFKSNLLHNDFYNKELIKAKIDSSLLSLPEDNTTYHFAWLARFRVSCAETCLRTHDDVESVLKQRATELQEQIKEFDF